jgi:hypothetical protein
VCISSLVSVVRCVERLMNIADEMDKETQRFGPTGREHTLVCQCTLDSVDLRDRALLTPAVAQVIISNATDRDINKMPGRRLWPRRSNFVCPD